MLEVIGKSNVMSHFATKVIRKLGCSSLRHSSGSRKARRVAGFLAPTCRTWNSVVSGAWCRL
jgi:hypothetical protein